MDMAHRPRHQRLSRREIRWPNSSRNSIDLLEIRRRLIAIRLLRSHNLRITTRINKVICELAHLTQPDNPAHEQRLIRMIAKTLRAIALTIWSDRPATFTGRKDETS
jgi:hypothetical protein